MTSEFAETARLRVNRPFISLRLDDGHLAMAAYEKRGLSNAETTILADREPGRRSAGSDLGQVVTNLPPVGQNA
jgi:hypothetical protein